MLVVRDRTKLESGYGVLEVVIVVSLSIVITTMALYGFSKARARYELTQKAQTFSSHIERARSIAIKLNKTLTLGFSQDKKTFDLTCLDCPEAKDELASMAMPSNLQISAYPTISLRGNGTLTVQGSSQALTLSDGNGRSLEVTLNNSGRVVVGPVAENVVAVSRTTSSTQ